MLTQEQREMEKRIVRKIDMRLMPILIVAYLLNYLDRSNLGNARTLNNDRPGESLVETLQLQGMRYNIVVALFFVPYVIFELPSNIVLKYFGPRLFLARILASWGIVTMCTAAVTSYTGLIIARVFLGVAEAGFFPGCVYLMCFWYKPSERATRLALFASSVSVAGATSGLIATGVSYLSGKAGLYGWQWLYILEGIPTILFSLVVYFFLPDWPESAKFLTPEERELAISRLGEGAPKATDKTFDKQAIISALCSWQTWIFSVCYFCMANSLNAFGFFAPQTIAGLGYRGPVGQAMTIPPNAFAFLVIVGNAWHSDRTHERPRHILAGLALVMTGYLLLATVTHNGVRYMGVMFIACTNAAVIPFVALRTATVSGATATALATGIMIAFSNSAGAVAPFLFISTDGPRYIMGNWTCFGLLGLSAVIVVFVWWKCGSSSEYRPQGAVVLAEDEENAVTAKDKDEKDEDKVQGSAVPVLAV